MKKTPPFILDIRISRYIKCPDQVPYSLDQVPGSFTGEVLRDELIEHISNVRKIPSSAYECIKQKLIDMKRTEPTIEEKHWKLQQTIKVIIVK